MTLPAVAFLTVWDWITGAVLAAFGVLVLAGFLLGRKRERGFDRGIKQDPAQFVLAAYIRAYSLSDQDEAAYAAFAAKVRKQLDAAGVRDAEGARQRLMHAAGLQAIGHREPGPTAARQEKTLQAILRFCKSR